ncbi:VOC family protein [Merismopedia glauca]|uniref:Bleomycin resistance protein n=1 Tax=Merismopedia glauca CCAP 1448/3 TaxID=1296344 RepID=A0A2T1C052_9CYAN|nr:VOC family protein [Merismopedia glauca]PSB01655.1 bleomycin resistance protein [Merismopedia glauca CCAP 1448/3]
MIASQVVQPKISESKPASTLVRFEHINLSTRNIKAMQEFYQILFPDWYIRAEGTGWMHLGNNQFYISLFEEPEAPQRSHQPYASIGFNHIGFVVTDGAAIQKTLEASAIKYEIVHDAPETKCRIYLFDPDSNELELIEYLDAYPLK